jgi:FMN phosphatase YigB (HAD superfamily)
MRDSSTEALLFDLGGVVFPVDFENALSHWAECAGIPAETLMSRYRPDESYERHERGEIEATEYFDTLRRVLDVELSDDQFAAGWNAVFEPEPEGLFELLASIGSRMPIYAFSNYNVMHYEVWSRKYVRTLALFRHVFVSCDMGLRKPDAAAFRHVTSSIGTKPENILFFDDTAENIQGARRIGMPAVQVRKFDDIKRNVTKLLE